MTNNDTPDPPNGAHADESPGLPSDAVLTATALDKSINALDQRISSRSRIRRLAFGAAVALMILSVPMTLVFAESDSIALSSFRNFALVFALYGVMLAILAWAAFPAAPLEAERRALAERRFALDMDIPPEERRAERQFSQHQAELERYYQLARVQASWIFIVGVSAIIVGFVTVLLVLAAVIWVPSLSSSDKALAAVLGGVSAIMSNFVAVIFLRMHSGTVQSLTDFHWRLVATHRLHFGNFLASKISDIALREGTIAHIAEAVTRPDADPASEPSSPRKPAGGHDRR